MLKIFLGMIVLIVNLFAFENLKATFSLKASGNVQTLVYKNKLLYAGTDNGTIEVFDTLKKEKIQTINIPKIKDFMGDLTAAKVYSIDIINNKILIISQGMKGYRNLWIFENKKLKKIIDINKKFFLQKAAFINKNKILFALLSNQLGIYDLNTNKIEILTQISQSSFSYFQLNSDKKSLATTDESGIVRVLNSKDLTIMKKLKALNLDKVYQLDYKQNKILTAGQDRKAVFYDSFSSYALSFDFLLYSCALSPDGSLGAVAYNEENEILVFDTKTKKYLYNLSGQDSTLTKILFINNKELFASSDSQIINYWRLK